MDNSNICDFSVTCNCDGIPLTSGQSCHTVEPKGIIIPCSESNYFVDALCYCGDRKNKIALPSDYCDYVWSELIKSCSNAPEMCTISENKCVVEGACYCGII